MEKIKHRFFFFVLLLLFFSSKLDAEENLPEVGAKQQSDGFEVTSKTHDTKSDESDIPCVSSDDDNENSNLDKIEPQNSVDKAEDAKLEDSNVSVQDSDSKEKTENLDECNKQSGSQDENSEEQKVDESDNSPEAVSDSKQQKSKEDEQVQKTSLSDVNSQAEDKINSKSAKRDVYTESYVGFGPARDASYFFDDLEPFINFSDTGRVGRAVPSREKSQKSKLSGKGKESIEDDADEEEEDEKDEEEEKQDEDEYDEDEDVDSDCQPTDGPTTPKCPATTPCPTTTTPCPPSTTKCTTKKQCPTTCRTTPEETKCPRLCVKADQKLVRNSGKNLDTSWDNSKRKPRRGSRRQMGYPLTTERTVEWDADKKRLNNKKRKFHSKVALSKE